MTHAGGRPTLFGAEMTKVILQAIEDVLVLNQVAGAARITRQTLHNWLTDGRADIEAGNLTEKAKFFYDVKSAQSEEIRKLQANIKKAIPNWQSQAWLLERCFREDFGADAGIINELLMKCEKLENDFKRMNDNQGVINHG